MDQVVKGPPHQANKQKPVIPPWYKRRYIINPQMQFKIVFFLAGIATVAAILICVVAYERLITLGSLFNSSLIPPAALPEAFKMLANSLMIRLGIIVILMILVFGITGILLTHRIAGPIWKLERNLKKFLAGEDIPPIGFRRSDEFRELPRLVNELMKGYKR